MNYNEIEILYAEDNADDAVLTLRALKKCGLSNRIFHVNDGAEALDFLYCRNAFSDRKPNHHLKLILLDFNMPKVSGIEVLEVVKSDNLMKLIPVVIFSSSKEEIDIKRAYEMGLNSYVVKPVDTDKFFNTIVEICTYWLNANQATL